MLRPMTTGRADRGYRRQTVARLDVAVSGTCSSSTRHTRSSARRRISSRPPTARDGCPTLASGSDARLLWYFDLAHGTGPSYRVVTVTGVEDGEAWARIAGRVADGDLRSWARHRDGLQHSSTGRVLIPLAWSPPIGALSEVPVDPVDHEPVLYMEDTMWPFPGRIRDYIEASGSIYRKALQAPDSKMHMSIELALQTLPGAGRYPEVTLLQKLSSLPPLIRLLTDDPPPDVVAPGSWMHEALELRDQWQSRLLRSAPWSPLP